MTLDSRNADFWNELGGTSIARLVGVTGRTPEDLRRFDEAFIDFYPYLIDDLPASERAGARVLEVGVGSEVQIDQRNIDVARFPGVRPRLLSAGVDRVMGLDLYICATA